MVDNVRWQQVDALFVAALDLDASSRASFIDEQSAGDESLAESVKELLQSADGADTLFEGSAVQARANILTDAFAELQEEIDSSEPSRIGTQLGAFELTRLIGRGGNASVYLGERVAGEWQQQVAIKVLRRGLDTDDVIQRFVAERRILSSLDHANIAQLLDGGSTNDGLPYFVMEYVSGQTITDYCDVRRLGIGARLRLFLCVARAVQHAHTRLVVHRDIKPSNILVSDRGEVKLLDFGIAKLLDPDALPGEALRTRTGYRPLTPAYASPEQIRGDAITVASDIYQLGVLLVELLTGHGPPRNQRNDGWSTAEVPEAAIRPSALISASSNSTIDSQRVVRQRGTSVARLARALRGDLDTIVLVATHPDPAHRYMSADMLIADLERHLRKEPITARRDSIIYRISCFIQRNPLFVPAALLIGVAAVMYGLTMQRHAAELEAERNLARSESTRARLVQSLLVDVFRSPDPYLPASEGSGRDITVREALTLGMERMRVELSAQPAVSADLQDVLADVFTGLGDLQDAYVLRADTLTIQTDLYGARSAAALRSQRKLGQLAFDLGQTDEAKVMLGKQFALASEVFGADHPEVARSHVAVGDLQFGTDSIGAARSHYERAIEIYRATEPVPKRDLALVLGSMASVLSTLGDSAAAIPYQKESLELRRLIAPPDSLLVVDGQQVLGQLASHIRDYETALPLLEASLVVKERKLGFDHDSTLEVRNNLALALSGLGRFAEAERELRTVLRARREKSGRWHRETAAATQNLATVLVHQRKYEEATRQLADAYAIYSRVVSPDHWLAAYPLLTRAFVQLELNDLAGAEWSAKEATRILRQALPQGHFATTVGECRWGRALILQGRYTEATPLFTGMRTKVNNPQMPVKYRAECLAALAMLASPLGGSETR